MKQRPASFALLLLARRCVLGADQNSRVIQIMRGGDNQFVSLKTQSSCSSEDEITNHYEDIMDEFRSQVQSIMLEARGDLEIQFQNAYQALHNGKAAQAAQRQAEIETIVDSLALHDKSEIKLDIFNIMEADDSELFVLDTDEESESILGDDDLSTESHLAPELETPYENLVDSMINDLQTIEADESADVSVKPMQVAQHDLDLKESTTSASSGTESQSDAIDSDESQIHNQMPLVHANEASDEPETKGENSHVFDHCESTPADAMNDPDVSQSKTTGKTKKSLKKKSKLYMATDAKDPAVHSPKKAKKEKSEELADEESLDQIATEYSRMYHRRHHHLSGEGHHTMLLPAKTLIRLLFWLCLFCMAKLFFDFVMEHLARRI